MKFAQWLESEEKDFKFYQNVILNHLGLDPKKGLSQDLNSFNKQNLKQKLTSLGIFTALPEEVQSNVFSRIDSSQGGTMGDILRLIAYKN